MTDVAARHGITQGLTDSVVGLEVYAVRESNVGERCVEEIEFTDGSGLRCDGYNVSSNECFFFNADAEGMRVLDGVINVSSNECFFFNADAEGMRVLDGVINVTPQNQGPCRYGCDGDCRITEIGFGTVLDGSIVDSLFNGYSDEDSATPGYMVTRVDRVDRISEEALDAILAVDHAAYRDLFDATMKRVIHQRDIGVAECVFESATRRGVVMRTSAPGCSDAYGLIRVEEIDMPVQR
jgi:hypothetical protein